MVAPTIVVCVADTDEVGVTEAELVFDTNGVTVALTVAVTLFVAAVLLTCFVPSQKPTPPKSTAEINIDKTIGTALFIFLL